MEFDPIIAVIIAAIIGLFSYVYYLHTQKKAPLPDLSSLTPLYEVELFTDPLTEKDAYITAKKAELVKAGKSEDEVGISDVDAEGKKTLNGMLLKRACAAVERAVKINQEIINVKSLQNGQSLSHPHRHCISPSVSHD